MAWSVAAASRQAGTPLAGISAADARDLPMADDSADAVLLLGPLYHLTSSTAILVVTPRTSPPPTSTAQKNWLKR
jgi:hypothetical protein